MPLPAQSVAAVLHRNEVPCLSPSTGLILLNQLRAVQVLPEAADGSSLDLYRRALQYLCDVAAFQQGLTISTLERLVKGESSES